MPQQPEWNQNRDGYRAAGRGTQALSCFGGGQNKRGPVVVQAWVEMFKHVRGGTHGSKQMKKSLSKPAITQVSPPQQQGRAGWGAARKRDKSGGNVSHFFPQTLRKRNKLSSAELLSETLHVFDHFVSDLHLKCVLAAPSQDFLHMSHELFLQAAPACCTSLGEQQGGSS